MKLENTFLWQRWPSKVPRSQWFVSTLLVPESSTSYTRTRRLNIHTVNPKNIHKSHLYGNIINDSSGFIFIYLYDTLWQMKISHPILDPGCHFFFSLHLSQALSLSDIFPFRVFQHSIPMFNSLTYKTPWLFKTWKPTFQHLKPCFDMFCQHVATFKTFKNPWHHPGFSLIQDYNPNMPHIQSDSTWFNQNLRGFKIPVYPCSTMQWKK